MRRHARAVLMIVISLLLGGCAGKSPDVATTGVGSSGTVEAGPIDLVITLAYRAEKKGWLEGDSANNGEGLISAFNKSNVMVGGKHVLVQGINKSSGTARTEML